MQKLELQVGRKYRGSGWVNEYGELHFRPEQKGSKPGNLRLVYEASDYSISESKNLFKVVLKIDKDNFSIVQVANKLSLILSQIHNYIKK